MSSDETTQAPAAPNRSAGPRRGLSGPVRAAGSSILGGLISFLLVIGVGFFLFRMLPGDPVRMLTRDRADVTPEQLATIRTQYGLDDPLIVQFGNYLLGVLQGDLGTSFQYRAPVSELITDRLGATLLLTGSAMLLAVLLGLPIGTKAGWRRGSLFDKLSVGISLTLWSMPTFWLALLLLMTFGVGIGPLPGLFPVNGMRSTDVDGGPIMVALDIGWHMVLPVITIVAVIYAQYVLVMRSSLLDEIGNEYLTTARAKGMRDALVLRRHAVPNALLPTVTIIMIQIGFLVTGAITTEYVFSWPGLGSLTAEALKLPDLPLLQGSFIVFSGCVILANVAADLLYLAIDPRLRHR